MMRPFRENHIVNRAIQRSPDPVWAVRDLGGISGFGHQPHIPRVCSFDLSFPVPILPCLSILIAPETIATKEANHVCEG